ncbi:MAG TPA: glutamate-5-semialdehyde dehydrogenase [Phototrophicaceae bacterium]|nr:glutamate-5-semialdehyde dehydrogenase [Phototrophicaceae bacterium]
MDLREMGQRAKDASYVLARATTEQKNAALRAIADAIDANIESIRAENCLDLEEGQNNGLSDALLDRMSLQKRLPGIAEDVRSVAQLPDPVGTTFDERTLDNGLHICRRRTPLGVLGVIYEARPNVTVDVVALSLKSGNAVMMRGGKEILRSNIALIKVIRQALTDGGFDQIIPTDAIQYIDSTDRRYVDEMLKLHDYIDMIIPRGGASLHQHCRENSTIPVITGGLGICHVYVDATGKLDDALNITFNAKTQRPSVCNSLDTLLVHQRVAAELLPRVVDRLGKAGVTFRAEPRALQIVGDQPGVQPAGSEDFDTEWMALILGLKVVDGLDEAMEHIRKHSTQHSDAIITETSDHAARFIEQVDSAAVFVNASTRFNDGGQLGLGAEIAVSTQKLHARGPMALEELTTYKWVVIGTGQVRP